MKTLTSLAAIFMRESHQAKGVQLIGAALVLGAAVMIASPIRNVPPVPPDGPRRLTTRVREHYSRSPYERALVLPPYPE